MEIHFTGVLVFQRIRDEGCKLVELNGNFVVIRKGTRRVFFFDIRTYQGMLEKLEELDEIRAYDAAKASREKPVPLTRALKEIESGRCR